MPRSRFRRLAATLIVAYGHLGAMRHCERRAADLQRIGMHEAAQAYVIVRECIAETLS